MTLSEHKRHFSRFLEGHKGKLHFAAHSHHFWPDVSRDGQIKYWDDCALLSDEKWSKIFDEVMPKAQNHIAKILNLKNPNQIAFAPNTHELASRLLSHFLDQGELSILTTSSEFHSWHRQLLRISELPKVKVSTVSCNDLINNRQSFIDDLKNELKKAPNLFFISQVFFDSGLALTDDELVELANSKSSKTVMVVDGYHAFTAIPTDLSRLEGKIFYLAGGYKYAQAGEGVGFMVIPKGDWRPAYTGWFAEYAELTKPAGTKVGYSQDWKAFMGATQDPSGLYRFNAVWDLYSNEGLNVNKIHTYILGLQRSFVSNLTPDFYVHFGLTPLFDRDLLWHGHFLTFDTHDPALADAFEKALKANSILIDRRGSRVRFGFGLYQDLKDVEQLALRLSKLAPANAKSP